MPGELHDDKAAIDCVHRGESVPPPPTHQERHQPFLRAPGLTWEQDGVCRTPHAQVIEHLGHLKGQSPEATLSSSPSVLFPGLSVPHL